MGFFSSEDISKAFKQSRLFGQQKATPARLHVAPNGQHEVNVVHADAKGEADPEPVRLDRSESQPPSILVDMVDHAGVTASRGIEP